jgi:NADPH:quinone reductase-like Zn-dependent oxidoreductase
MKAIVWNGTLATLTTTRPCPRLRPTYVLVQVASIALNPTDVKAIAGKRAATDGLLGSDFSGTVLEVGSEVTKSLRAGDKVFGFAHGANSDEPEDGAWAEVIAAKGDCVMKIPEGMEGWGFDEASTMGASVITAAQGLVQGMGLRLPEDRDGVADKEYVLVYGGSSSTGLLALQFCKL